MEEVRFYVLNFVNFLVNMVVFPFSTVAIFCYIVVLGLGLALGLGLLGEAGALVMVTLSVVNTR